MEIAALRRARARGTLTLRVSNYIPLAQWRGAADSLRAAGPGDDWIRTAGVKGFVDGSLGSTTALMFEPYLDQPGTRGLFVTPEDSLRRWIGAADSAGLQVIDVSNPASPKVVYALSGSNGSSPLTAESASARIGSSPSHLSDASPQTDENVQTTEHRPAKATQDDRIDVSTLPTEPSEILRKT